MKKVLVLLGLSILTTALADRIPANLKGFKSICIDTYFEEQGKKSESSANKIYNRIASALKDAQIPVAASPCEGLTSNKQLNLYHSFITTNDGVHYYGALEGWLDKEGPYSSVTLWRDSYFGALDKNGGLLKAASTLDKLLQEFIDDWKLTH